MMARKHDPQSREEAAAMVRVIERSQEAQIGLIARPGNRRRLVLGAPR